MGFQYIWLKNTIIWGDSYGLFGYLKIGWKAEVMVGGGERNMDGREGKGWVVLIWVKI